MTRYLFFMFATMAMADTAPIADENLRIAALQAIFPGMRIALIPGKRIGDPSPKKRDPYELDAPDALAKENVYRVVGKATTRVEQCASENIQVSGSKFSDSRLLRLRLYPWPKSAALLAVLQYSFEGVSPAGACWSVGLLTRLEKLNGVWNVRDPYVMDPMHHTQLLGIRLLDLTNDGGAELVVEPDFGGAGTWGSKFLIFDLSLQKFDLILDTTSRISYETDDMYPQVLDIPKTALRHGDKFCFTKTTTIQDEEVFKRPLITHPCYGRGDDGDRKEAMDDQKMWLERVP